MSLKDLAKTAALTAGIVLSQSGVSPETGLEQQAENTRSFIKIYADSFHDRATEVINLTEKDQDTTRFIKVKITDSNGEIHPQQPKDGVIQADGSVFSLQVNNTVRDNDPLPLKPASTIIVKQNGKELTKIYQPLKFYTTPEMPGTLLITQEHIGKLPFWKFSTISKAVADIKQRAPSISLKHLYILPYHGDEIQGTTDTDEDHDEIFLSTGMLHRNSNKELYYNVRHEGLHLASRADELQSLRQTFCAIIQDFSPQQKIELLNALDQTRHFRSVYPNDHLRNVLPTTPEALEGYNWSQIEEESFVTFLNIFWEDMGPLIKNPNPEDIQKLLATKM